MDTQAIVNRLRQHWPDLMAVYAFGSRISGHSHTDSDLDLAILLPGYVQPEDLWQQAGQIADLAHCPVDLLDFRAASTVMQHQILTTGSRWWKKDSNAELYEAAVLSEKLYLDEARQGILDDIRKRGSIYGR